jgi:hypothetical protein
MLSLAINTKKLILKKSILLEHGMLNIEIHSEHGGSS